MGTAAEVTARLAGALFRANVKANETFLEGQLLGYFGSAAGASRIMGLSPQQTHSAPGNRPDASRRHHAGGLRRRPAC